jgi:predicted DNA-binding protein (MmcQ/YjbR family)
MPHITEVIRSICLSLPETQEVESHGSPDYRVEGKSFATFQVNHHGDGMVALLLNATRATQQMYVQSAPDIFFVPAYVGPKGWYGIDLSQGMRWDRVAELAHEAYASIARAELAKQARPLQKVPAPDSVDVRDLDPIFSDENQAILQNIRQVCLGLPETIEDSSFGTPNFRAGKKSFCQFYCRQDPTLMTRGGKDRQIPLSTDKRFSIPPYMGHNGWISLSLEGRYDKSEVDDLILESYRHFALKRMLKALI